MAQLGRILWVDDEIDLLRSHCLFLESKGYEVSSVTNGIDALELIESESFDIVFVDENMSGLSGLDTLSQIKRVAPAMPVVMITKNEAEDIMELAIGKQITDFLTKPVNPSQILIALKKHLHQNAIVKEQITSEYSREFMNINNKISSANTYSDFVDVYKQLTYWDLRLDDDQNDMLSIIANQKEEANFAFAKYISKKYQQWFSDVDVRPMMSPDIFPKELLPMINKGESLFLVVIDNFRYDQWKMVEYLIKDIFTVDKEKLYFSILPTTTQYARNSLFSALMPLQIKEMYPNLWVDDFEEEAKNLHEEQLIDLMLKRYRQNVSFSYHKVNNSSDCQQLIDRLPQLKNNRLNVCVLNFIDMLSHARTEMKVLKEIAHNEQAYRALATNWFKHSSAMQLFKNLATMGCKVAVTTDHGTVRVSKAVKVVGDKNTTTNLRYKVGKSLSYNNNDVFEILNPKEVMLPCPNVSSTYIFAKNNNFMAYPNNFNYYATYFKDSFQHGGISMEEMIVPFVILNGKV